MCVRINIIILWLKIVRISNILSRSSVLKKGSWMQVRMQLEFKARIREWVCVWFQILYFLWVRLRMWFVLEYKILVIERRSGSKLYCGGCKLGYDSKKKKIARAGAGADLKLNFVRLRCGCGSKFYFSAGVARKIISVRVRMRLRFEELYRSGCGPQTNWRCVCRWLVGFWCRCGCGIHFGPARVGRVLSLWRRLNITSLVWVFRFHLTT